MRTAKSSNLGADAWLHAAIEKSGSGMIIATEEMDKSLCKRVIAKVLAAALSTTSSEEPETATVPRNAAIKLRMHRYAEKINHDAAFVKG